MKKIVFLISYLRLLGVVAFGAAFSCIPSLAYARERLPAANDTTPAFTVDGQIALHSLMSISDAHLQQLADILKILATTDAVRSGDWERIHAPLAEAARMNVPAVYWFAQPDGAYWTLDKGRVTAKLSDREYFPRLLAGQAVIGQLEVSRSTNCNTAIVAAPIHGPKNSVVGALGCSVHLDSLSELIRSEMGGLEDAMLFYSIDVRPLVALNSEPKIIFIEPMKLKDEGLHHPFSEMLSGKEGVVKYTFQGIWRTVLYHKSSVTGW